MFTGYGCGPELKIGSELGGNQPPNYTIKNFIIFREFLNVPGGGFYGGDYLVECKYADWKSEWGHFSSVSPAL